MLILPEFSAKKQAFFPIARMPSGRSKRPGKLEFATLFAFPSGPISSRISLPALTLFT